MNKKMFLITFLIVVFLTVWWVNGNVLAEKSGSSPESAVTSYITTIYDSLVSLSHGSDSSGSWGDWSAYWNRIRSAAEWLPSGDASESEVVSGKIFYKDSRTQKTGTASLAQDWSTESLQDWDDYRSSGAGDTTVEEATWTNTAGVATTGVWKDSRTGLYWTVSQGYMSNSFTRTTCDFFDEVKNPARGYYFTDPDVQDSDCGNAINTCANLSLAANTGEDAETDWYLPSQKEILQAYIDGIYNTNATFATTNYYWTSTEVSDNSLKAWHLSLGNGYELSDTKTNGASDNYVRCVRRD